MPHEVYSPEYIEDKPQDGVDKLEDEPRTIPGAKSLEMVVCLRASGSARPSMFTCPLPLHRRESNGHKSGKQCGRDPTDCDQKREPGASL